MTPAEFCSIHTPAVERDEARHNVMLAVLGLLANDPNSAVVTWSLGSPGQCATMTPGRPLLLADLSEEQCRALAEQTAQLDYPGVVGELYPCWRLVHEPPFFADHRESSPFWCPAGPILAHEHHRNRQSLC